MKLRLLTLLVLACIASACSGLAGEPRVVATIPPPTAAPTDVGHPITPPDLVNGAAIFAEHCTQCHGINGAGDGELVLTGQVQNVPNFTMPDAARPQRPSDWYETITEGRIENLMPPWRDTLSEQQRWDVALYTYSMHYTRDQIEHGRELYNANCVDCHGEGGLGDGERASEIRGGVKNLTDQRGATTLSDQVIRNIIDEGSGGDDGMPSFAEDLTEDEMFSVVSYVRTLSLTNTQAFGVPASELAQTTQEAPAAQTTDEVDAEPVVGTVSGAILNGSAGGTIPANAEVTLFIFTLTDAPQQLTTTSDTNGVFRFEAVTLQSDAQYVATTVYRERVFTSELLSPSAGSDALNLSFPVYELTEDPSVIEISGMVSQVTAIGDSLEVAQVFTFRNTSDRAFSTSQLAENGRFISLVISLPPGAVVTGFTDDQARYVLLPEQFLVVDTVPVLPGEDHIFQVIYIIQYAQDAIIEQPIQYPFNGAARLLMRPTSLNVSSAQLAPLGIETIGTSEYAAYGAELALNAGDVIRYDVSGTPLNVNQREENLVSGDNLPIVIIVIILAQVILIGGLYLWFRQNRRANQSRQKPDTTAMQDALVRQIAALDAAHDKGEISDEYYQRQRAALKAQLADLMKRS